MKSLFHMAYHVTDLKHSREFYGNLLGCTEVDQQTLGWTLIFFGHQISLHMANLLKQKILEK